ncbi:hypothetical protein ADK60_37835 [Streptomyces sp. XY431]|uniref:hypothetical protein n=1 Tax=Streptomyces sp. XY431 TaxID=1415562 RepID=UPI0006C6ED30|nr:hypothetical protein [Streptomyces sp. XY431]KOV10500.1 hypothetical protein ADK60_37835 [Streptomyces sp. XY431]
MTRSVVFVHGTGVRTDSYLRTLASVEEGVRSAGPDLTVRGCFWGEAMGAKLALGGASIPDYLPRDSNREADAEIAAWAVLHRDPWHELRLLALRTPPPATGFARAEPPSTEFLRRIATYQPGERLSEALKTYGLGEHFAAALDEIRNAPELRDAASTADHNSDEHRRAAARGLLACTLGRAVHAGLDAPAGTARDNLMTLLGNDLEIESRSVGGAAKRFLAAPILYGLTWKGRRDRSGRNDAALEAAGDILRYQARGQGVRDLIRQHVANAPGDEVTLIAHSLGGVACVDLLLQERLPRINQLITVGSQAPFFHEIGALTSLDQGEDPPPHFIRRWLNIYDPRDLLSFRAATVFRGHAHDVVVDNGQPFPLSHSAYWTNPEVWEAVKAWMA